MTTTVQQETQRLSGTIERVTFHSEETGFCVLKVRVPSKRELVTVVGSTVNVSPGEYLECSGDWAQDKNYGLQFSAKQIKIVPPHTLDGIQKYLASGMIKGIGPHFAKRLIKEFKEDVFNVIENEPERLLSLSGIGSKRKKQLIKSWSEQAAVRDIMLFLQSYGVGTSRAVRIYKTYGNEAISKVRENPYRLSADIHGIGFKSADDIAQQLGIPQDSMIRAQAGIRYMLTEFSHRGHCAAHHDQLCQSAMQLLGIPRETIENAIEAEKASGNIIQEPIDNQPALFIAPIHLAEASVAAHFSRLAKGKTPWKAIDVEQALPWVEEKTGLKLSDSQQQAVKTVIQSKVCVITGGPGVGKTTIVNSILEMLKHCNIKFTLCAPTGRAAKRLSESTGLTAKTIHRLLEFDPSAYEFKRNSDNPVIGDFFVIDESSMVDISLMNQLIRAIPDHAALLLVGDIDQLPSVGPGNVLADVIESQAVPVVRLTEIFRQSSASQIIINAHRVNEGAMPIGTTDKHIASDFYIVEANTPEHIHEKLIQVVTARIPKRFGLNPIQDVQVLTPMNQGGLGTRSLNVSLQRALNPDSQPQVKRFDFSFAPNDKVIQTVNNYDKEVFNGDIGVIHTVNRQDELLRVRFDERLVTYEFSELDELSLAYATTIHKSQGSEYPAVVIPISTQHYTMLQRNLLYTGITRGKKLVVLIGQSKAINMAVRNKKAKNRLTNLAQRLKDI